MKKLLLSFLLLIGCLINFSKAQCPIDIKGKQVFIFKESLPENSGQQLSDAFDWFTSYLSNVLQNRDGFGVRIDPEDILLINQLLGETLLEPKIEAVIRLQFKKVGSKYECVFNTRDIKDGTNCNLMSIMFSTIPLDENDSKSMKTIIFDALINEGIFANPNPVTTSTLSTIAQEVSTDKLLIIADSLFRKGEKREAAKKYAILKEDINLYPKRVYPIYYLSRTTGFLEGIYAPTSLLESFLQNANKDELVKVADDLDNQTNGYNLENNYEYSFPLWKEAYNKGNLRAAYKLGLAYLKGRGVAVNSNEGIRLLDDACNGLENDACNYLASHYMDSNTKDCKKAYSYLKKAAVNKDDAMMKRYKMVCEKSDIIIIDTSKTITEPIPNKTPKENPKPIITPPILIKEEPTSCSTSGCQSSSAPKWVAYNGNIPSNAVQGAKEGNDVRYLCRCNYMNGKQAGKVVDGKCNIGWGGKEVAIGAFEVLVGEKGCSYVWSKWNGGTLPPKAIEVGTDGNNQKVIYAIKGIFNNAEQLGKLQKGDFEGSIGYGGKEEWIKPTHILISCSNTTVSEEFTADCPRVDCSSPPFNWVVYQNKIPEGAVVGGREGDSNMYVCRCQYQNGTHTGKLVNGKCNIGFGGAEKQISQFEVLTGSIACNGKWSRWTGKIPSNALVAGTVNENGNYKVYIIKANINGSEQTGKLREGNDKGSIGFGGEEKWVTPTHILIKCN